LGIRTRLKLFHLFHLSHPASDRPIYQAAYQRRVKKIVEVGVGLGRRGLQLIEVARQHFPAEQIAYTGLDPFETRTPDEGPGLSLKQAYRLLHATGARIRLVPGDPLAIFSAMANNLGVADLVLIGWPLDRRILPRATYYLRRMIHDDSLILLEERPQPDGAKSVKVLSHERIQSLAATFRRAA
jgi:hypothetical protein